MHITLKQLEIFLSVVEHLNFTHASKDLNMTQPAVSNQIKNLEQQLGLKLFEQVGKKTSLTNVALQLLPKVHNIQSQLEALGAEADSLRGLLSGKITLTLSTGSQKQIFQMIKAFLDLHPNIEFDIKLLNRIDQLKQLQANTVDLAITGKAPKQAPLYSEVLFNYDTVFISPVKSPKNKIKNISIDHLTKETLIAGEHYSNSRTILEKYFNLKTCNVIEINNSDSVKYAVSAGLGIAIVSTNILDKELINKQYSILNVDGFPIKKTVYIVNRHRKLLSPAALTFKEFAQQYWGSADIPSQKDKTS